MLCYTSYYICISLDLQQHYNRFCSYYLSNTLYRFFRFILICLSSLFMGYYFIASIGEPFSQDKHITRLTFIIVCTFILWRARNKYFHFHCPTKYAKVYLYCSFEYSFHNFLLFPQVVMIVRQVILIKHTHTHSIARTQIDAVYCTEAGIGIESAICCFNRIYTCRRFKCQK